MRDRALDTLTREHLRLDTAELCGNPWPAAGVLICLFSMGQFSRDAFFMEQRTRGGYPLTFERQRVAFGSRVV